MNMWREQRKHDDQKNDLCAKQEAVKKVDQRGAHTHHSTGNKGEQQYSGGGRERGAKPVINTGCQ